MNIFKHTRSKLGLAAALVFGLATSPIQAQSISDIQSNGKIKVGVLVDFPPLGFMNSDNKPDGYDPGLATLLAKKMEVELEIVPVTGPNRIPFLLSGQVDILVSSLAYTAERAEKVDFSDPYAAIRIGISAGVDLEIETADQLTGYSVAVTRASGQDTTLTSIAPEGTEIRRFDDDVSAVQALLSGQVDAIGVSNIGLKQIRQVAPGKFEEKFEMNRFQLAVATRPDASEMMDYVNVFLSEVVESGKLNELHQMWFEEPLPTFKPHGQ